LTLASGGVVAVHGLATLWLNGNLPPPQGTDPEEITRRIARWLTGRASPGAPRQGREDGHRP